MRWKAKMRELFPLKVYPFTLKTVGADDYTNILGAMGRLKDGQVNRDKHNASLTIFFVGGGGGGGVEEKGGGNVL